jgi:dTDP-4-dehydrorhamnose 3,5-epimerase
MTVPHSPAVHSPVLHSPALLAAAAAAAAAPAVQVGNLQVTRTAIPDVMVIEPRVFGDARGFFLESFNQAAFNQATGLSEQFVQDNHSRSTQGVLRGLHYQIQQPQGKLVRVVRGAVFDVAVDIRRASPTFGQWVGIELNEDSHHQFWVPAGFAHGFVVLSESADFLYKTTEYYQPAHERCIAWDRWRRSCRLKI